MLLLIDIPEKLYEVTVESIIDADDVGVQVGTIGRAIANGQIIPDDCEILTKEAYADLCYKAAGLEREVNNE